MSRFLRSVLSRTGTLLGAVVHGAMRSAILLTEAAARQKIILAGYDAPVGTRAERQRMGHAEAVAAHPAERVAQNLRLY